MGCDVWVRSGVSRLSTVGHLLGPDLPARMARISSQGRSIRAPVEPRPPGPSAGLPSSPEPENTTCKRPTHLASLKSALA